MLCRTRQGSQYQKEVTCEQQHSTKTSLELELEEQRKTKRRKRKLPCHVYCSAGGKTGGRCLPPDARGDEGLEDMDRMPFGGPLSAEEREEARGEETEEHGLKIRQGEGYRGRQLSDTATEYCGDVLCVQLVVSCMTGSGRRWRSRLGLL